MNVADSVPDTFSAFHQQPRLSDYPSNGRGFGLFQTCIGGFECHSNSNLPQPVRESFLGSCQIVQYICTFIPL